VNVLIAYASKYGAVKKIAGLIAERLPGAPRVISLRDGEHADLSQFDVVLVGGSIYAGKVIKEIPAFCDRYREQLLGRQVGLFLSCLYEGETAEAQLREAFPPWLSAHAFGSYLVGGEIVLGRLRFFDRVIVKKVANLTGDVHKIDPSVIDRIVADVGSLPVS